MATREQFGDYLLLKKLTEDPLGEAFRAGKVGDGGLEQVVLLRVLDGPRLDAARLMEGLAERRPIQQGLKSPTIGNGVDLGEIQGIPYVAYDYISGKNLATLLSEAERQSSPVPLDHGVLIAERVAQALAQAFETRLEGERVLHGFVVPHLVRVSNEGETRLLGFEMGPLLQAQAGRGIFDATVASYLAPEVLAGEPGAKADDVYSLGAMLFHLLTGRAPTARDPEGLLAEIGNARVAEDGQPIPPPLVALLKKSLAPRGQRIGEAVAWHKELARLHVEGPYNATPFNLAFFMHNLFRSEIEQETQELEEEKNIQVQPPASFETEIVAPPAEEPETESTGAETYVAPSPEGESKTGLWIGLAAVILIAVAAGLFFFMRPPEPPAEPVEATASRPATPPEPVLPDPLEPTEGEVGTEEEDQPQGPTPEEIEAQIQEMISASSAEMEAKLKAQYEERLAELQRQLSAAEQRSAQEPANAGGATPGQTETGQTETGQTDTRQAGGGQTETAPAEAGRTAAERRAANAGGRETADAGGAPPPTDPSSAEASAVDSATEPAEGSPRSGARTSDTATRAEDTTRRPARTAPREPEPSAPVEAQPAQVQPPELVRPPQPRYPEIARRMGREATVLLRVLVDERGRVVEVERLGKRVGSGLDEAAIDAAHKARYRPGTEDGVAKAMWTTLRIEFRP